MADRVDHLTRLVQEMHGGKVIHEGAVLVDLSAEHVNGHVWKGYVEMFALEDHPTATRAFAWCWSKDAQADCEVILAEPPICSPREAVWQALTERG